MVSANWKDIAELVGIAAIVASLLFVGLQMAQDQDIAEAQAYMEAATLTNDQTALLASHREIWIAGLNGEDLSVVDESIFQSLVYAVFQRKVAVWQRRNRLDAGSPDGWMENFAFEIYRWPGLRNWWSDYYGRRSVTGEVFDRDARIFGFSGQVQAELLKLDARTPQVPPNPSHYLQ